MDRVGLKSEDPGQSSPGSRAHVWAESKSVLPPRPLDLRRLQRLEYLCLNIFQQLHEPLVRSADPAVHLALLYPEQREPPPPEKFHSRINDVVDVFAEECPSSKGKLGVLPFLEEVLFLLLLCSRQFALQRQSVSESLFLKIFAVYWCDFDVALEEGPLRGGRSRTACSAFGSSLRLLWAGLPGRRLFCVFLVFVCWFVITLSTVCWARAEHLVASGPFDRIRGRESAPTKKLSCREASMPGTRLLALKRSAGIDLGTPFKEAPLSDVVSRHSVKESLYLPPILAGRSSFVKHQLREERAARIHLKRLARRVRLQFFLLLPPSWHLFELYANLYPAVKHWLDRQVEGGSREAGRTSPRISGSTRNFELPWVRSETIVVLLTRFHRIPRVIASYEPSVRHRAEIGVAEVDLHGPLLILCRYLQTQGESLQQREFLWRRVTQGNDVLSALRHEATELLAGLEDFSMCLREDLLALAFRELLQGSLRRGGLLLHCLYDCERLILLLYWLAQPRAGAVVPMRDLQDLERSKSGLWSLRWRFESSLISRRCWGWCSHPYVLGMRCRRSGALRLLALFAWRVSRLWRFGLLDIARRRQA